MTDKINLNNLNEVVHDLKTPITSIMGFIELLQQSNHTEDERQEFYGIIAGESERLLRMVNDILYVSKSNMQNSDEKCNISIEIQKYVKELTPLAAKRNISIDINTNANNIYISIPENQIARILTNIIENAIKYNKDSGQVFIDVAEENGNVVIRIKDTGMGIDQEDLDKVFYKYYRSNASKQLGVEGSGIGLAIAKDIAESYNGKIEVTSEIGKQTEFTISFPIAQVE